MTSVRSPGMSKLIPRPGNATCMDSVLVPSPNMDGTAGENMISYKLINYAILHQRTHPTFTPPSSGASTATQLLS